jgi:hypothetical protein
MVQRTMKGGAWVELRGPSRGEGSIFIDKDRSHEQP